MRFSLGGALRGGRPHFMPFVEQHLHIHATSHVLGAHHRVLRMAVYLIVVQRYMFATKMRCRCRLLEDNVVWSVNLHRAVIYWMMSHEQQIMVVMLRTRPALGGLFSGDEVGRKMVA
jgi:hypothetical protein